MSYTIETYSEKAIAVFGDLDKYANVIVALNGCFNNALKGPNNTRRKGCIFPTSMRETVERCLADVAAGRTPSIPQTKLKRSNEASSTVTNSSSTFNPSSTFVPVTTHPLVSTEANEMDELKRIVSKFTSKVEALEVEVLALRKLLGNNKAATSTVAAPQQPIAKENDEAMDDDDEERNEKPQFVQSLIVRNKKPKKV